MEDALNVFNWKMTSFLLMKEDLNMLANEDDHNILANGR
jgi:hypothetical protein